MRFSKLWFEGYRSLRQVELAWLPDRVVLYGPNGSGKSNLLQGAQVLLRAVVALANRHGRPPDAAMMAGADLEQDGIVRQDDVFVGARRTAFQLGGTLELPIDTDPQQWAGAEVGVEISWDGPGVPARASLQRLNLIWSEPAGPPPFALLGPPTQAHPQTGELSQKALLEQALRELGPACQRAFAMVSTDRTLRPESFVTATVEEHLKQGRLKNALLAARVAPEVEIRKRFEHLVELLRREPLGRPRFDPVHDPIRNRVDLREEVPGSVPPRDVPLDLKGLGVTQIYFILAGALLTGASVVGLEEPEAHLHAPTTGLHLRRLLDGLVPEPIQQLFVATHSNLFDLDETGYFDVRLEGGATRVERCTDLSKIDEHHLYEPGPAKHALQRLLRVAPPDTVVFRDHQGHPIPAREMLRLLQQDDAAAVEFLRDVHATTIRALRALHQGPRAG